MVSLISSLVNQRGNLDGPVVLRGVNFKTEEFMTSQKILNMLLVSSMSKSVKTLVERYRKRLSKSHILKTLITTEDYMVERANNK